MEKKLTDEVVVAKNAITDEEIAKAILQQIEYNAGIPYIDEWLKVKTIKFTDILNFIHRLQGENERLTSLYNGQSGFMTSSIGDLPLTVDGLRNSVDEISRLLIVQGELQDLNAKYYNEAKDLRRENAEQKAEIERLTEWKDKLQDTKDELEQQLIDTGFKEYCEENKQLTKENAELQKQVDELKEERQTLVTKYNQTDEAVDYWCEKYKQAVKDTAKEILTEARKWVKAHYKDKTTDSFGERPLLFIESFGCLFAYLKERYGVEVE